MNKIKGIYFLIVSFIVALSIIYFTSLAYPQDKFDTENSMTIRTVTIDGSDATGLSDAIDLAGYRFMTIIMPSSWTTANLTFQACQTFAGTYVDMYDDSGTEITVVAAASRAIVVDLAVLSFASVRFVKVRSGTTGTPVTQAADRTITLLLAN